MTETLFGPGRLRELPQLVRGRHALLVTTAGAVRRGLVGRVLDMLKSSETTLCERAQSNPSPAEVAHLTQEYARVPIEVVIGLGGGSAIDTAKALGANLSRPIVAIPTTAGSGSEVTPFVALWDRVEGKKLSFHSGKLLPEAALLDPELCLSLSWEQTLSSGLDALSHAFESIWNRNANPDTLQLATRSIRSVLTSQGSLLEELREDPGSIDKRTAMMEVSLLSGLAISQTQTALAHAISYPLTARRGVPHGLACCFSLPAVLLFNEAADDGRLKRLAEELGFASVRGLAERLARMLRGLQVGSLLSRYLESPLSLSVLASEMLAPERSGNSLREANSSQVQKILGQSLELLHFTA